MTPASQKLILETFQKKYETGFIQPFMCRFFNFPFSRTLQKIISFLLFHRNYFIPFSGKPALCGLLLSASLQGLLAKDAILQHMGLGTTADLKGSILRLRICQCTQS